MKRLKAFFANIQAQRFERRKIFRRGDRLEWLLAALARVFVSGDPRGHLYAGSRRTLRDGLSLLAPEGQTGWHTMALSRLLFEEMRVQHPDLEALTLALRKFAAERNWDQFHSPKNLATALAVEAGEILEHFQWLKDDESRKLEPETRDAVSLELADVLLYLLRLADKLDIDVVEAANRKLALNAKKYPIDLARGSAKKYTEF